MTVTKSNKPQELINLYFDQVINQLETLFSRTTAIEKDAKEISIDTGKISVDIENVHRMISEIKVDICAVEKDVGKLNECYHDLDKQLAVKISLWSFLVSVLTIAIAIIIGIATGYFGQSKTEYVYPPDQINSRSGNSTDHVYKDTIKTYRLEDHLNENHNINQPQK